MAIEGDPEHPASQGGLCCRGNIALQHLDHPDRVNYPLKRVGERGSGRWERVSWDEAMGSIASKLGKIRDEYGAEAVATAGGTTHRGLGAAPLHESLRQSERLSQRSLVLDPDVHDGDRHFGLVSVRDGPGKQPLARSVGA